MKLWPLSLVLLGGYGLFAPAAQEPRKDVLVIYGNVAGYLSPCGCTYPMSGGIQRMGSFLKALNSRHNEYVTLVMPGGNVAGTGEQNEFKAECVAETAYALGASALGYSEEDAALGPGIAMEMSQLSKNCLISSSLAPSDAVPVLPDMRFERFVFGSISPNPIALAKKLGAASIPEKEAMSSLLAEAGQPDFTLVVSYDGNQQQAETFARQYLQVRVLIYQSTSDPPTTPEEVGDTLLVTPGFHGKNVVTLTFEDGKFESYSVSLLGPDFKNDPDVGAIYSDYLHRVDRAHLLDRLPRYSTAAYGGSASCRSCHEKAFNTWAGTGHAHAYRDLSAQGHGLDPDCVSCHVVGLSSKSGFKTLSQTPQLANVGCESCHGPGRAHNLNPRKFTMPKVKPAACVSCHTLENSPGFDYKSFWPKVAH